MNRDTEEKETKRRGGIQTGPFGFQLHAADYIAVNAPTIKPVKIAWLKQEFSGLPKKMQIA